MRLSLSEAARLAAVLLSLALPAAALAHPDLLAQIDELSAQLQEQPANPDLLLQRGDLYRRHQDYAAAQADFAAARAADPGSALVDFYQGRLLLEIGAPADAVTAFNRYLAAYPGHALALSLRAEAWSALEQLLAAAADYGRAIRFSAHPGPDLYRRQAEALIRAGEAHWPEAQAVIDSGLQRFTIEVSLQGLGCDLALARGQPEKAMRYLETLPAVIRELPRWKAREVQVVAMQDANPGQRGGIKEQATLTLRAELSRRAN